MQKHFRNRNFVPESRIQLMVAEAMGGENSHLFRLPLPFCHRFKHILCVEETQSN